MVQNKHPGIHLNFNLRVIAGTEFPGNGGDMFECLSLPQHQLANNWLAGRWWREGFSEC